MLQVESGCKCSLTLCMYHSKQYCVLYGCFTMLGKTKEGAKMLSKVTADSKAKGNRKKELNEDSGSDYGDNWSGDEWNDAQV